MPLLLSQIGVPSPTKAELDLTTVERFQRRWEMVDNPVERVVAQNRLRRPTVLQIEGMLSADAINLLTSVLAVARLDRAELTKLIRIVELSTCFVVTPERALPNMGCLVLDETYDDDVGRGVKLSLMFREFQIARPGAVEAELDLAALDIGALSATDMGSTTPQPVPDLGGFV
ncbi:MAG: hypothetical protein VYA51_12785 [Planctomycetota bacterium]|nr:hypothetical protein [Planctomycetota bacterium]